MQRLDDRKMAELLSKARQKEYQVCVWGAGSLGTGAGRKFLVDHDIRIDYYCDNNPDLIDKIIIDGIYCRSQKYLIENSENTICFLLLGYTMIESVYQQVRDLGIKYIVTYEDVLGYSLTLKKYFPFMASKDIVVYTCITGDYDDAREPEYISDRCDYYLISDKKPEKETIWQWINIKDVIPPYITDSIFRNRYCKINVDKVFPQYRYSIYVDGNITIMGDITESIGHLKKARVGVTGMYEKDTVYLQALRCMAQEMDYPERWQEQMRHYWLQGLPEDTMVYLCNILVREHNNPICVKLMREWWKEFCKYVRRDQISFPYVLWKNGIDIDDMLELDKLFHIASPLLRNNYWKYERGHKQKRLYI